MAYYKVGEFLRSMREVRRITQEELAEGIISAYVLSKIENNKQMPRKVTFDALVQRLGLSAEKYSVFYLDKKEFWAFEKRDEMNRLLRTRKIPQAVKLIDEMKKTGNFDKGLHLQFLLRSEASVAKNTGKDNDVVLNMLKNAIEISIPEFDEDNIEKYLLTEVEIEIINMIALNYANKEEIDKAVELLYRLKKSIDKSYVDENEKAKHLQLVLYNLSKYLGLAGRHREVIEICDKAIRICIDNGRNQFLPKIVFNKAYSLLEIGDTESCKRLIYQAYYGCDMFEKFIDKQIIKDYAKEKLNIEL